MCVIPVDDAPYKAFAGVREDSVVDELSGRQILDQERRPVAAREDHAADLGGEGQGRAGDAEKAPLRSGRIVTIEARVGRVAASRAM